MGCSFRSGVVTESQLPGNSIIRMILSLKFTSSGKKKKKHGEMFSQLESAFKRITHL